MRYYKWGRSKIVKRRRILVLSVDICCKFSSKVGTNSALDMFELIKNIFINNSEEYLSIDTRNRSDI